MKPIILDQNDQVRVPPTYQENNNQMMLSVSILSIYWIIKATRAHCWEHKSSTGGFWTARCMEKNTNNFSKQNKNNQLSS